MTHQAPRTQAGTKIVIAGSTPAALQAALGLAQVNLEVELWMEQTAVAAWPLTAVADSEKALQQLYQTAAEVVHSSALQGAEWGLGKTYLWQTEGPIQLPEPQLAGITAAPLAPQMQQLLGWPASIRAYCDRLLPVLNIGKVKSLAALVAQRQGKTAAVLPELVNLARTGQRLTELETETAVPHLNEGLTKTGSLSGAIAWLAADMPALSYPLQGAVAARNAVLRALQYYGVTVHTGQAPSAAYDVAALLRLAAADAAAAGDALAGAAADKAQGCSVLVTLPATLTVQPGDEIVLPVTAAGEVITLRDKQRPALAHTSAVRARVLHPAEAAALQQAELFPALAEVPENTGLTAVLSRYHEGGEAAAAAVLWQAAAHLGATVVTEVTEFVLPDPQWQHTAVQELHEIQLVLKPLRRKLLGFDA